MGRLDSSKCKRPNLSTTFLIMIFMHALHVAIHVERHARTSSDTVAKPVPALANRNLLRREDAANRLFGVLGISLARTQESLAFLKMDRRNGALCKADA